VLLADEDLVGKPALDNVACINVSALNLIRVINDILSFARMESGKVEIDNKPFALVGGVLEPAIATVQPLADAKNLHLAFSVGPNVPSNFIGDAGRSIQVLINFLGNAIKFTAAGSVTISVEVEVEKKTVTHAKTPTKPRVTHSLTLSLTRPR
jgi:signal transduction histidine kinase